jgi:prepilin-type processing-associated H-X9-DG protein
MIRGQAKLATSQSNMRQMFMYLTNYSNENRGYIVPSRFDYSGVFGKSLVRSASPAGSIPNVGPLSVGSWADILWTTQNIGPVALEYDPAESPPSPDWNYRFDSPDYWAYRGADAIDKDIFRSTQPLMKPFGEAVDDQLPTPFGLGAGLRELGQPGYFAANDFFDATAGNWYTTDMIRRPSNSMYLVDSRAGETIAPTAQAWLPDSPLGEVEFRYIGDVAIMLFLDGHVTPESKWQDLAELQNSRPIRIERLDQN